MNESDKLLKKINKDEKINKIIESSVDSPDIDELFKTNSNQDAYFNAIDNFFKDNENIDTKTDISPKEVKIILRLKFYSKIVRMFDKDNNYIDDMLLQYFRLQLSSKRQSRKEFFDALGRIKNNDNDIGWFGRRLGMDKK
jgi:hypothetical protein